MCMKNINAVVNYEAMDEKNNVITSHDNDNNYIKIVPIKDNSARLFVSFSASIINGKDGFFDKYRKLYFQLRLAGGNDNLILNEFSVELNKTCKNYFTSEYADFLIENSNLTYELNLKDFDIEIPHVFYVLVKTDKDFNSNKKWTVQSATPISFKKVD